MEGKNYMQTKVAKFTFTVPELTPEQVEQGITREDAGQKLERSFDYQLCDNDAEAQKVIADKKWSVVGMVNDIIKANARSNAYQAALLPYRPSDVSLADIKERMIRDYIRCGVAEDAARKQVESLLAASV